MHITKTMCQFGFSEPGWGRKGSRFLCFSQGDDRMNTVWVYPDTPRRMLVPLFVKSGYGPDSAQDCSLRTFAAFSHFLGNKNLSSAFSRLLWQASVLYSIPLRKYLCLQWQTSILCTSRRKHNAHENSPLHLSPGLFTFDRLLPKSENHPNSFVPLRKWQWRSRKNVTVHASKIIGWSRQLKNQDVLFQQYQFP